MKTHVVVTHYRNPLTSAVVMHAYGPYEEDVAKRARRRILAEHADDALHGVVSVSACKMIDIDAMNAHIKERETDR